MNYFVDYMQFFFNTVIFVLLYVSSFYGLPIAVSSKLISLVLFKKMFSLTGKDCTFYLKRFC